MEEEYVTSQIAAGFIKPFGKMEHEQYPGLDPNLIERGHQFFRQLLESGKWQGIRYMDFYDFSQIYSERTF